MDRPALLAIPVLLLSVLVVPLRSIVVFRPFRDVIELTTLSLLSRPLWMTVAIVGFAALGYAYGRRTDDDEPKAVLGVAGLSSFVGVAIGYLFLRLVADGTVSGRGSLAAEVGLLSSYTVLEAAMFGLLVVGGYALAIERSTPPE